MKNIKISKDKLALVLIIFFESLLICTFKFDIFPAKYFYDSKSILTIMSGATHNVDSAYLFTAKFFGLFNFLNLNSIEQWANLITLIFTFIIIKKVLKTEFNCLYEMIFIILSTGLLNIYVFSLSKDIIQFILFIIIYLILKKVNGNNKKILFCSIVFLIEALIFRLYYLITAILVITIYFVYKYFIDYKNNHTKGTILKVIIMSVALFFVEVFMLHLISVDNYNMIMNARSDVNINRLNSLDAITIIIDPLGNNSNYFVFIGNYIINFFRMLFPIELTFKGAKYSLFIIYQLIITKGILDFGIKLNKNNVCWIIVVISYLMTAIIFEPDFGSFIRHESTLFMIFLEMLIINYKNKEG